LNNLFAPLSIIIVISESFVAKGMPVIVSNNAINLEVESAPVSL
jgi:hypothetical protein